MDNFTFFTPTKVFFGKKQEYEIGNILNNYGIKRVLLHYGSGSIKKSGLYDIIINSLKAFKIDFYELGGVIPNPSLETVLKGIEIAKTNNIELILAVGGGSVIDSAKLIATGSKVSFDPFLFNKHIEAPKDALKVGVILTLAASGSEMSASCVITNYSTKEKRGYNSDYNRPLFAIMNPELTYTLPKYQTACGIVDILMHTLERYFSKDTDAKLTDNIAEALMKNVIEAGKIVLVEPNNYEARKTLMWAGSLSHNGLTGVFKDFQMSVHQIEHELSAYDKNIAHGAGLAVLWPSWAMHAYKTNISKFATFGYNVFGISREINEDKAALLAIESVKKYFKSLEMPSKLSELGLKADDLPIIAHNFSFNGTRVIEDIITVDEEMCLNILNYCL